MNILVFICDFVSFLHFFYNSCMSCVFAASNYFATKKGYKHTILLSSGGQFTRIRSGSSLTWFLADFLGQMSCFVNLNLYSVIHRVKFHDFLSEVGFQCFFK